MQKMISSFINQTKRGFCKLFGHQWRYKDYSKHMKPNGEDYDFKASRSCARCKEHAYFYGGWETAEKSKLDFEHDSYATKKQMQIVNR